MKMNNLLWDTMLLELTGRRLNNFGANTIAQNVIPGAVVGVRAYNKLSEKLATPDRFQRLDMMTGPKTV
jgi:hypothetical protein